MIKKMAVASGLLAICLFTLSASPQPKQIWEYKFDYKCTEKHANELAAQGWELATHSSSPLSGGNMAMEICIFKRPKV